MASRYWVGGTANWDGTAGTKWATTTGGAGGASVPGSGDDVFFDANSGSGTVTVTSATCAALDTTGFGGTIAGSATISANGSVTIGAGTTWSNTADLGMSGATGGTLTTNGKTIAGLSIGAGGGAWQLGDALTATGSVSASTGSFTTNNHNISATGYSFSGGTINLGSSVLTATGASPWSAAAGTTVNAGTSTIKCTSTANKVFSGGGKTYNIIWHAPGSGTGYFLISGANTFSELKDDGSAAHTIFFPAGATTTVTTFNVNGSSSGAKIALRSGSDGTQYTLSKSSGTVTSQYLDIKDCVATGGATWIAQQSTDSGNNSGWSFPAAYTMIADSGSYVLTGNAVNLNVGWLMPVGTGAFTLTGVNVNFGLGYGIVAEPASFALAGIDVALRSDIILPAGTGEFLLTGNDATLTAELVVIDEPEPPSGGAGSTQRLRKWWESYDTPIAVKTAPWRDVDHDDDEEALMMLLKI